MINFLFGQPNKTKLPSTVDRAVFNLLNNDVPIIQEDWFDYVNNGFMSVGAVYEVVDLISKKISAMPVIIYKVIDENKLKQYKQLIKSDNVSDRAKAMMIKSSALQEVEEKSIRKLLDNPNQKQSWTEFIGIITHLYLIDGNGFIYGNGSDLRSKKWTEMYALPFTSKEMKIISGGVLEPIKGYNANWSSGIMDFPDQNQILHLKTINPRYSFSGSQLYGVSPLKAYTYQLVRNKYGNKQANKILNNGGVMGLITPKHKEDQLSKEQKEDLKERFLDAHGSNDALARIIPASISMDWLQFGLPSTELQIIELLDKGDEAIYKAYHVPFSYASNKSSTYNNQISDGKRLIYDAIAPVSDYISEKLTSFICSAYKDAKYKIELDYMSSPEMVADMKEVVDWLMKTDFLTQNEKREVIGWGKIEDPLMDKVYLSKQKAPIEKL